MPRHRRWYLRQCVVSVWFPLMALIDECYIIAYRLYRRPGGRLLYLKQGDLRALGRALAEGFVEFGADGGSHTKADVIASLQTEPERARALSDFRVTILADNVVLATYRATRLDHLTGEVVESLRSSVWTRVDEGMASCSFTKGTRVEAAHIMDIKSPSLSRTILCQRSIATSPSAGSRRLGHAGEFNFNDDASNSLQRSIHPSVGQ